MRKYTQSEISEILRLHKLWVENKDGGVQADLRYADLRDADLRKANLQGANLQGADLRYADLRYANLGNANLGNANLGNADLQGADLQGADLDFACWPLWCGSSKVKIDEKIARQLFAHVLSIASKWVKPTKEQIEFANGFHRIVSDEFPKIE